MDAGVLLGRLELASSNSDGTTIIILGPNEQVQMGNGVGRPDNSMNTPSATDPASPDMDQPPERDQPSDVPSPPAPIISSLQTLTPTETSSPIMITDTPAIESTTETSDKSSETPMVSTSLTSVESSDALPSLSSSSLKEMSSSAPSDSASLSLPGSSTKAMTKSISFLSTSVLASKSSTATTSSASSTGSIGNISSTSHSQISSSSLLLSSGTASQASATAAYRPLSSNSQELNAHSPSFYVAVSVAAIAGSAIIVALIAWCIRLLTKARRRSKAHHTTVPWGDPFNDKQDRMEGGQAEYGDGFSSVSGMNLGSDGDLAHAQAWQHRNYRDVGEPQRARFDANGNPLRDHPIIPGRTLPADYAFDEVDLGPYLRPNQNFRHLPSHLVDENLAARARLEACPIYSNIPGPPFSLRGGVFAARGLSPVVGYEKSLRRASSIYESCEQDVASGEEPAAPPRSVAERLRNMRKSPIEAPREQLARSPKPNEHQRDEAEAWAASLKNSLVNAFNAVAINISGAPRMQDRSDAQTRRFTRQSVRDVQWENSLGSGIVRGTSVSSKDSKPWTLEETREGAGVVHLHINDAQEYRTGVPSASVTANVPGMKEPLTSVKLGDASVLVGAHGRQNQRSLQGGISRESSIYSTLSAYPEWRGRPSRQSSINPSVHSARNFRSLRVTNLTHESRKSTIDSVVIQPHPITRLPSTASSATHIQDVRRLEANAAASHALRERQERALKTSQ